jgi:hypothetical protein
MTTSTCTGLSCVNLTELFDFIKSLKTLDLYGVAHQKCCDDGSAVGEDCNCPDKNELKAHNDLCFFDYCASWTDVTEKLNWFNDTYNNDDLPFVIVTTLAEMIHYAGSPKDCYNLLTNKLPKFWVNSSTVMAIVSGFIAATWTAVETVKVAVKTEYYNSSDGYVGANFLAYGGVSWVGDLLGLFEISWVFIWMLAAMEIAGGALWMAEEYKLKEDKMMAMVAANGQQAMDMQMIFFNFLIAFGGWMGAVHLKSAAERLIGFFDLQNSDGVAVYKARFTGSQEVQVDNAIFLIVDVLHHTFVADGYATIAFAMINLPLILVWGAMNPDELKKMMANDFMM